MAQGARRWAAVRRSTWGTAKRAPGLLIAAHAAAGGLGLKLASGAAAALAADDQPGTAPAAEPSEPEECVASLELPHARSSDLQEAAASAATAPNPEGARQPAEPWPEPWKGLGAVDAYEDGCRAAGMLISVRVRACLSTSCAELASCRLGRPGAAAVAAALRAPGGCSVRRLVLANNCMDALVRCLQHTRLTRYPAHR